MITRSRKEIIAWEKGYYVNGLGEVFSRKGNQLKLTAYNGYYQFSIRVKGKKYHVKVHRLQAYQKFKDRIYDPTLVIRHLNGNSFDNSFNNIGIGTHHDNTMDIPRDIRLQLAMNASKKIIKYPLNLVNEIKEFYNNCKSYKKTMEKYNISSKGTLWHILNERKI